MADTDVRTMEDLAAELAWCLRRFVDASADELTMQRAELALLAWEADRARIAETERPGL